MRLRTTHLIVGRMLRDTIGSLSFRFGFEKLVRVAEIPWLRLSQRRATFLVRLILDSLTFPRF